MLLLWSISLLLSTSSSSDTFFFFAGGGEVSSSVSSSEEELSSESSDQYEVDIFLMLLKYIMYILASDFFKPTGGREKGK